MTNEEQQLFEMAEDLKGVLRLPEGRRFLKRLFSEHMLFAQTRVPGDEERSAFNDGRREVCLGYFHEIMRIDPRAAKFFLAPETARGEDIDSET